MNTDNFTTFSQTNCISKQLRNMRNKQKFVTVSFVEIFPAVFMHAQYYFFKSQRVNSFVNKLWCLDILLINQWVYSQWDLKKWSLVEPVASRMGTGAKLHKFVYYLPNLSIYIMNKRSVLRRQSRDTNRNAKRSVYCQYG